jgi:DNA-directed RNA polymerase specialized sigma subunit
VEVEMVVIILEEQEQVVIVLRFLEEQKLQYFLV